MFVIVLLLSPDAQLFLTVLGEIVLGYNSLLDVESDVFVLYSFIHCAGDPRVSDVRVLLYSRRTKHGAFCPNLPS